jgi:amino acid permease
MQADNSILDEKAIELKSDQDAKIIKFEPKEKVYGIILLFAGAFAVSYLVMPGSFAKSGMILATLSLIYSSFINYRSTGLILKECRKNNLKSYYEYYTFLLGKSFGNFIFIVFFFNAFLITVVTLTSLNDLIPDFMKNFTNIDFLVNSKYCFWAIMVSIFSTPFIYKSTDESMMLISILTGFAILMSLSVVVYTFFSRFDSIDNSNLKYFDLSGSVFSFDISYFSFIVQLNIFDLFLMFKGDSNTKFRKIKKVSLYTNFVIFVPYFIMGNCSK